MVATPQDLSGKVVAITQPKKTDTAVKKPRARKPAVAANKHDAKAAQERVKQLAAGLAERGVATAALLPQLQPIAEATAACRVLVAKGLVTNEEMITAVYVAMEGLLAGVLQQVEEQRLRESKGPQLEVARTAPLAIARR